MPTLVIGVEDALHYSLTPLERADEVKLEAWWPETKCSPLPCPHLISRWSDGGWRVGSSLDSYPTADAAARAYLELVVD